MLFSADGNTPVARYLDISIDELNERQEKAKTEDLEEIGKGLAAKERRRIRETPAPAAADGKPSKKPKKGAKTESPSPTRVSMAPFGIVLTDDKGVHFVSPVNTVLDVAPMLPKFTPAFNLPTDLKDAEVVSTFLCTTEFVPPKPRSPKEAVKVSSPAGANDPHHFFMPWAEADAVRLQ